MFLGLLLLVFLPVPVLLLLIGWRLILCFVAKQALPCAAQEAPAPAPAPTLSVGSMVGESRLRVSKHEGKLEKFAEKLKVTGGPGEEWLDMAVYTSPTSTLALVFFDFFPPPKSERLNRTVSMAINPRAASSLT